MVKTKPKDIPIEAVTAPLSSDRTTQVKIPRVSDRTTQVKIPRVSDRTSIDPCLGKDNPIPLHDDSACHILDSQDYALAHPGLFSSKFVKNDSGKTEWSLLPFEELEDVVKVLMLGAKKYSVDNWKNCTDTKRYKDALMRHVVSYIKGDIIDEESGLNHLAHAVCNCLFLMWFDHEGRSHD